MKDRDTALADYREARQRARETWAKVRDDFAAVPTEEWAHLLGYWIIGVIAFALLATLH